MIDLILFLLNKKYPDVKLEINPKVVKPLGVALIDLQKGNVFNIVSDKKLSKYPFVPTLLLLLSLHVIR